MQGAAGRTAVERRPVRAGYSCTGGVGAGDSEVEGEEETEVLS
jgi:hypothetical protein